MSRSRNHLTAGAASVLIALGVAPVAHADFGFSSVSGAATALDGSPARQAGSHPDLTTTLMLNTRPDPTHSTLNTDGSPRDITVDLPVGFVGNPTAAAQCTSSQLAQPSGADSPVCPVASQVGIAEVVLSSDGTLAAAEVRTPIYNTVHSTNEPGRFAFQYGGVVVYIVPRVRPTDYGVAADSLRLPESVGTFQIRITLWGIPADHAHDALRADTPDGFGIGGFASQDARRPFLTLPTSCPGTPSTTTVSADSWQNPGVFASVGFDADADGTPFVTSGCERLGFDPAISVVSRSRLAGAPAGVDVDLSVPQSSDPDGLATANLRKAVVVLPVGMAVSPSSAAALGSCSPAEVGLGTNVAPSCPDSSKIGTVEVDTPLIDAPLHGDIVLAKQNDNPFGSLLALYIVAKGPGFYLKLPGRVVADPVTGQLTTTFDNNPQLPFSDLKLSFNSGPQAPLSNPRVCGVYHTVSELTSWASDVPVTLDSPMVIDEDCDAGGRFEPVMSAGVVSPAAGVSSPFTFTLSRPDGEQDLSGLSLSLPTGLLGHVGSVPLCAEAQAAAGTCSAASQVGSVVAAAGAGPEPSYLPQAGKAPTAVYLAGPYRGAPFSLTIVVPAQVGPFDLGTVVLRAAIYIDPHDAHVTVVSDPFPTILQGIPLDTQKLNLTLDRPGFMVTPTSCNPLQIAAHVTSTQGAAVDLANRFQLGGCSDLPFKPTFSASTTAKTSRANGASLDAKIVIGERGEANAHVVSVDLPKQLPSRLTTIQKACLAATFAANPAACPAESLVGSASSKTEVLADPLSGPAYLVSHGGAAFPDLVVVLQGDGVRFDLVGAINISSKGITSTKFSNAPDAPIDTFELKLPQGPHSILTSNGSLCAKPLVMPTTLTAYNGKQITQSTRIKVSGCPKAKKAKKHKVKKHRAKAKKGSAKAKAGARR